MFPGNRYNPRTDGAKVWVDVSTLAGITTGTALANWTNKADPTVTITQAVAFNKPSYQFNSGDPYVNCVANAGTFDVNGMSVTNSTWTALMVLENAGSGLYISVGASKSGIIPFGGYMNPYANGGFIGYSGLPASGTGKRLIGGRFKQVGAWVYQDGQSFYMQPGPQSTDFPTGTETGVYINGNSVKSNIAANRLKAYIIYDRYLTDVQWLKLVNWAKNYYSNSINTQLPVTKNIVWDGNSLLATGNVQNNVIALHDTNVYSTYGYKTFSFGIASQTTTQMIANYASKIAPTYDPSVAKNILIVWEGTNDLRTIQNPTTVYNNIVTYCNLGRATGFKVIVVTILPRSDAGTYVGFVTDRLTVNASIVANWATFADALVDLGGDVNIGQIGQELNTVYYQGDKVHLNFTATTGGHAYIQPMFTSAIAAL